MRKIATFCLCVLSLAASAFSQLRTNVINHTPDPRGEPELTICSQNLENYGSYLDSKALNPRLTTEQYSEKESSLIKRFVKAGCDVIAMQELVGKDVPEATKVLDKLSFYLRKKTGKIFQGKVGVSADPRIHLAFLVASDRAEILNSLSYSNVELPKFGEKEKPKDFLRDPFEIQLKVKAKEGSFSKHLAIVTFHFKSKRGGEKDPTGLSWETQRMQEAEGLRRILENRHSNSLANGDTVLVTLGDRNSNFDQASAKILEGVLNIKSFQGTGVCRLSKRAMPLCQKGASRPQRFFSVLTGDPETKELPGSYFYKGEHYWIDDILMPAESLIYARTGFDTIGNYESGLVTEPTEASDHALTYVRLNW